MHRITHPAKDVDIVPALLIVIARRIVVDTHLVVDVAIEIGIFLRLQDGVDHGELGHLLRLERPGIVKHLAVAVPEDIGGEPAFQAKHTCMESGSKHGLHHGLSGLVVLAADGRIHPVGQLEHGRHVNCETGSAVDEGHALSDSCVGVAHRRSHLRTVGFHRGLEVGEALVGIGERNIRLG